MILYLMRVKRIEKRLKKCVEVTPKVRLFKRRNFVSIPKEESDCVRYLISDIYNPYIRYIDKYFPIEIPSLV